MVTPVVVGAVHDVRFGPVTHQLVEPDVAWSPKRRRLKPVCTGGFQACTTTPVVQLTCRKFECCGSRVRDVGFRAGAHQLVQPDVAWFMVSGMIDGVQLLLHLRKHTRDPKPGKVRDVGFRAGGHQLVEPDVAWFRARGFGLGCEDAPAVSA